MSCTSKERMLLALHREKPDRLPATVHQWQPYHLERYMGGMSDLEAFAACGLDAALARLPLLDDAIPGWGYSTPEWRIERRETRQPSGETIQDYCFHTPAGTLTMQTVGNEITVWVTLHLIKREEDIDLIERYMPVPRLDRRAVERDYDRLGDAGILRGFVPGFQPGPWQDAVEMCGMQTLLEAVYEKPDWVHRLLAILTRRKEQFIEESLDGARYDLIETGGGAGSSTVISPAIFEEFLLPYDTRLHRALRARGLPSVYHTCGGMTAILDLIRRNECDAAETLTPHTMGGDIADPGAVKRILGSHVCLIGGVDQEYVLKRGDEEAIRRHVRELFASYGAGGGYMASPSDHFFDVPREKLLAYARAARECRYEAAATG